MSEILKGKLGWKGERGYSAYEIAVQNGYEGTEQDWLATLGTSSHFTESYKSYTISDTTKKNYALPSEFVTGTFVSVYLNGLRLTQSQYSIDETDSEVDLDAGVSLSVSDVLEIVESFLSTNNLPIVDTIDSESTNDTAPGSKCMYDKLKDITDDITEIEGDVSTLETTVSGLASQILLAAYPVGSVYLSITNTNPGTLFGGTWSQIAEGRALVGVGTGTDINNNTKEFEVGNNGGEYTHQLTVNEMPSHSHTINTTHGAGTSEVDAGNGNTGSHTATTTSVGGNIAHNNVQPTFGVYVWKRTA